jgi:hypothetical protein
MIQQDIPVETGSTGVVEIAPVSAIEEPDIHVIDPEPTEIKHSAIDPEPTEIKQNTLVDPEPTETKPSKNSKNSLFEMLFKSFSGIFQRW